MTSCRFQHNPDLPTPSELLPHPPPMMLISGVLDAQDKSVRTFVQIGPAHALFLDEKGCASPSLLLELMAQTVGCWAGLAERREGQKPRIGFLLGTRRFDCRPEPLPAGMVIVLESTCTFYAQDDLPTQFECFAYDAGGRELARTTLTAYMPRDLSRFTGRSGSGSGAPQAGSTPGDKQ